MKVTLFLLSPGYYIFQEAPLSSFCIHLQYNIDKLSIFVVALTGSKGLNVADFFLFEKKKFTLIPSSVQHQSDVAVFSFLRILHLFLTWHTYSMLLAACNCMPGGHAHADCKWACVCVCVCVWVGLSLSHSNSLRAVAQKSAPSNTAQGTTTYLRTYVRTHLQ